MKIKALLFDLDGTLVNTLPYYLKSYDFVLKNFGIVLPESEIVDVCFGKKEEDICESLNISEKTKEFRDLYFQKVKEYNIRQDNLFDNVTDTLIFARKNNIKIALISFAYRWYVDKMLSELGIVQYFDTVIGFDDVKMAKPDPEGILLVCKKFNLAPGETMMIGDSESDIKMGNAAGSETVLFFPKGYNVFYNFEKLKLSKPKYIAGDFNDIKELIEGIL